jgi:polygalacturonase
MATRFLHKFSSVGDVRNLPNAAGIGYVNGQLYINGAGGAFPVGGPLTFGTVRVVDPAESSSTNDIYATIQAAESASSPGDVILIAPGSYDETVTVNVAKLTFIGLGGRGAAFIEPSAAGAEGMQITGVDDVTLINLGIDGDDTADYALNVNDVSRFRAFGCKFELGSGTGPAVLLNGTATGQVGDALFRDCEFAWAGTGVQFDDSAYGYPTQIFIDACRFHNLTTAGLGLASGGGVLNLHVTDCVFDNLEDGTAPTDYVKVDRSGDTGIFSGNRFATATNAASVLTIATGIKWVSNATEAGWSTARPS